jgi:hypothetical protein
MSEYSADVGRGVAEIVFSLTCFYSIFFGPTGINIDPEFFVVEHGAREI